MDIEKKSLKIIEKTFLKDYKPQKESCEIEIVKRAIHASGDPELKELLVFKNTPVKTGITAIRKGSSVICDVKMVKTGINASALEKFGGKIKCFIDHEKVRKFAEKNNKTRASSAFLLHESEIKNSIAVIGNAPTALFELCRLIDRGIKPRLVIASPPGFVGAKEAKEEILKKHIPVIAVKGSRGGSAIAAAIVNAIIRLAGNI